MSAADLLGAADRALYLAKRTGKGRIAVASPDAEQELDRLRDSGGSPAAVQALVAAIEARDNYSFDHSELVVRLATASRCCSASPPTPSSASATARCCTTSASWPSRPRSCRRTACSTTPSGW